jgi:hypothetical protein
LELGGAGCAIVEKLDDQPEEVFPLRFGAASGVVRAALKDGPGSRSELRDFEKGKEILNEPYTQTDDGGKLTVLAMAWSLHLISTCLPL